MPLSFVRIVLGCSIFVGCIAASLSAQEPADGIPILNLPDAKIAEVYRANWVNTLRPCTEELTPADLLSPHSEVRRPWKVDVNGHYPGWYPGVDVKHQAAAYLACGRNLPLVLAAWDLTTGEYMLPDGGIKPSTMHNNPQGIWPEATAGDARVYYPLRGVATIDYLLLGDIIFRYSQDREWLARHLPAMRRARDHLAGWMDDDGLLLSYSYDLDQVYREIDGVAQASAYLAFRKLAALEGVLGNTADAAIANGLAERIQHGSNRHLWDSELGYYAEHLAYRNVATPERVARVTASSTLRESEFGATKAVDGIVGIGVDAFGVGIGAAGEHEWATDGETEGAWIQIEFKAPATISRAILTNRTAFDVRPGERFASGSLEFSDGSPAVEVSFNALAISRAVVNFEPRTVTWVRFVGKRMQGEGGGSAGLAEFVLLPDDEPYRKFSHGMTDTNLAMVAFGVADDERAARVWDYFREHEASFYRVGELAAPTWIAEKAETYRPDELNKRAPFKDCVAIARIWRYDALMRRRMLDAEGIVRTLGYANALFDRPSGGGVGWFAERYGLGRFQPGDEAQATIPKYAGYPAIYNSTIVQEALLGLSADVEGTIHIAPCVPEDWYRRGFGQTGCGMLDGVQLGFTYGWDRFEGTLRSAAGERMVAVQLPPGLAGEECRVVVDGEVRRVDVDGGRVEFRVDVRAEAESRFWLEAKR